MTPNEAKSLAIVAVSRIEAKTAADERRRDESRKSMLSDDEAVQVVNALHRGNPGQVFTDDELLSVLNTFIAIRFLGTCVDLAVKGLLDVKIDPNGQSEFDKLVFDIRRGIEPELRSALRGRTPGVG